MTTTEAELFNSADYRVPFPQHDGREVEEITLSFTGRIRLNRNDPAHAEWVAALTLGEIVTLRDLDPSGVVVAKAFGVKSAVESEGVSQIVGIRVESIDLGGEHDAG
jgi:hypothetical protein